MLHVCPACRTETDAMDVRADPPTVVCPDCGHERPFARPPLCVVTGAAGTGKTTVRRRLAGDLPAVLLEDDALAHEACAFDSEAAFGEYVLRLCRLVAQSAPPVLFTTGLGVPGNVEGLTNRRYFGESHYLALTCDPAVQAERLRARPGWEGGDYWADVDRQVEFNEWFRDGPDGVQTLETTDATEAETAGAVAAWLRDRLPG